MRRIGRWRAALACILACGLFCAPPVEARGGLEPPAGPEAAAARAITICNAALDAGEVCGPGEWARGTDGYLIQSAYLIALPGGLEAPDVRDAEALARYRAHDYAVALEYAVRISAAPFYKSVYLVAGVGGARPDEILPAPGAVLSSGEDVAARAVALSWLKGRNWARFSTRRAGFAPAGALTAREKGLLRGAVRFWQGRQGIRSPRALYLMRLDGRQTRLPEAMRRAYRPYRYVVYAEALGPGALPEAKALGVGVRAGVRADGGMEACPSVDELRAWTRRADLLDGARLLIVDPAHL